MAWRLSLTRQADLDIEEILRWSHEQFGEDAADRYEQLIFQALRDIRQDPGRFGCKKRLVKGNEYLSYHLSISKGRLSAKMEPVKNPRHIVFYLKQSENTLSVVRLLHESMEFKRHL